MLVYALGRSGNVHPGAAPGPRENAVAGIGAYRRPDARIDIGAPALEAVGVEIDPGIALDLQRLAFAGQVDVDPGVEVELDGLRLEVAERRIDAGIDVES